MEIMENKNKRWYLPFEQLIKKNFECFCWEEGGRTDSFVLIFFVFCSVLVGGHHSFFNDDDHDDDHQQDGKKKREEKQYVWLFLEELSLSLWTSLCFFFPFVWYDDIMVELNWNWMNEWKEKKKCKPNEMQKVG